MPDTGHPKLPGLARWSRAGEHDALLNANAIETTAGRYDSVVLEETLADPSRRDSRFLQFFPSSELTGAWANPGTKPTLSHRSIPHTR